MPRKVGGLRGLPQGHLRIRSHQAQWIRIQRISGNKGNVNVKEGSKIAKENGSEIESTENESGKENERGSVNVSANAKGIENAKGNNVSERGSANGKESVTDPGSAKRIDFHVTKRTVDHPYPAIPAPPLLPQLLPVLVVGVVAMPPPLPEQEELRGNRMWRNRLRYNKRCFLCWSIWLAQRRRSKKGSSKRSLT